MTYLKRLRVSGFFQLSLLVFLAIFLLCGFGLWACLRHWRFLVATQLRLDRCVQKTTVEFQSKLNSIENLNQTMKGLRVAGAAATIHPATAKAIRTAPILAMSKQELTRHQWKLNQGLWIVKRGCDSKTDFVMPLPTMIWKRKSSDQIGPYPIEWSEIPDDAWTIQIRHRPRGSAAQIRRGPFEVETGGNNAMGKSLRPFTKWNIRWCRPSVL